MTPDEAHALIDRALETRTLGAAIIALNAVKQLELCLPGTTAKLDALLEVELEPVGEPAFEGRFLEANHDGFCNDCGMPYAVGETIFWRGPGRGVDCQGCRIAETDPKVRARAKAPEHRATKAGGSRK